MALISFKNLAMPFSNKVHLGTMVFTVMLFVTFRAAGGAFSLHPTSGALRPNSDINNVGKYQFEESETTLDDLDPRSELKKLGMEPRRDTRPRDDLLRSMTGANNGTARSAPAANERPANGGDLSELERRLGIR